MTPADQARENAIQCEMVLYAYRKNKDGVVVSFVVHPNDMPAALATAPIGARFVSALVMVGDDELPVSPAAAKENVAAPRSAPQPTTTGAKRDKRDWRDIPPPQQAGIRCADPIFAAFLKEQFEEDWQESAAEPAECVRLICGVVTRTQLLDGAHRVIWKQLDDQFVAWSRVDA